MRYQACLVLVGLLAVFAGCGAGADSGTEARTSTAPTTEPSHGGSGPADDLVPNGFTPVSATFTSGSHGVAVRDDVVWVVSAHATKPNVVLSATVGSRHLRARCERRVGRHSPGPDRGRLLCGW